MNFNPHFPLTIFRAAKELLETNKTSSYFFKNIKKMDEDVLKSIILYELKYCSNDSDVNLLFDIALNILPMYKGQLNKWKLLL